METDKILETELPRELESDRTELEYTRELYCLGPELLEDRVREETLLPIEERESEDRGMDSFCADVGFEDEAERL